MKKHLYTFKTEPFTNFQLEENKQLFKEQLEHVSAELGKEYSLIIDGKRIKSERFLTSYNPGNKKEIIGTVFVADTTLAEQAHVASQHAFETWRKVSVEKRAQLLFDTAALLRERKHYFSSWLVYESGKNWVEADADTAEAIDFLEYYGRQMLDLANPDPLLSIDSNVETPKYIQFPNEKNTLKYIPLGVGIILPPWNFPLAILAGMTTAAIVAGNTVILKPSERTSVIGYKFVELLEEAGMPKGVVNYLPGYGTEIGDYLVDHPKTRFISFTGSKTIGQRIYERAGKTQNGQIWLKRVVAEMGGKDGIVVDETADLDRAARDIVTSAFGFQGQKCSAGSRAIIVESVYEEVKKKILTYASGLTVGSQLENHPVGPVCDEVAFKNIVNYIEIGQKEGTLLLGGKGNDEIGYYIEPTIIENIERHHRVFQEEIFGPVLTLTKAKEWKEAIDLYNDTEYGLTGAFHSKNEERIEEAYERMHCGNLYINKKCTGALVGIHPFGGFNMSGTDSKAGGPDYLLQFTQAKLVTRLEE